MKNLFFLILTIGFVVSCKNENDSKKSTKLPTEPFKDTISNSQTYAEISVRKGGSWKENNYIGGKYENVKELEVPKNHTDHSGFIKYEGPGWENQNVAYRLYLDWRNAIDIFGKRVDTLVLPFVGQDDFGSYHEDAEWGLDILKAGKSLGIGGFGRFMNDTVAHFRNVENTTATINNLESSSSVDIFYEAWTTGNETIDLEAKLSIFPEGLYTKVELFPSKEIEGLATGIVKHVPELIKKQSDNSKWAYIATFGAQTLVNDTDKLGMAVFYNTEQLDKIVNGENDHLVIFKPTTEKITYYFLGAWEQQKNGIATKKEFNKYLIKTLKYLESNNIENN
ncbi:DUF4861 family protein [Christiangramia crocea]|uniref:DUF4861 domain-containing protein n=1 Tax=Christiangramia crocea TaxID=2904124 RepID=A0A9X2A5F1_9FLAO|nr:DUF4861 family protein [Gramella crocea]MCG9971175.1 DUF4861 domain-containing protein [Gramella crocea]